MEAPQTGLLAISATFTAESLQETLAFWMRELGWEYELRFAPYHQVFQQLLDASSLLADNRSGFNVVLARLEDWAHPEEAAAADLPQHVEHFAACLKSAAQSFAVPLIVCICPGSPEFVSDPARAEVQRRMEERIVSAAREWDTVHVLTPADLEALYPVEDPHSPHGDELGHVPYTPVFFSALGTLVMRKIQALRMPPYKAIALDCDDTLWRGICGEEGPRGVAVTPARRALQEFLAAQHDAGRLLCLLSKNNREDVLDTFAWQPDMVLRLEHFAGMRINWQSKAANLIELAEELGLGLDSFVLLDDDPKECSEVESNCPDVLALALPREEEEIPDFLRHVWALDSAKATEEDRSRNRLYVQEREREHARAQAASLAEFLASLRLDVRIRPMVNGELRRVTQLIQRTNQMNFTGRRRSESELQALLARGEAECLTVHVSDRFGDYGLTGVVLYCTPADALVVDSFLLSCRALGRGVEHRMLAELGRLAQAKGLEIVDVPFVRTPRNLPARLFLEDVGLAFQQSAPDGICFQFPAEYAAGIRYEPDKSRRKTESTDGRVETEPGRGGRQRVPYARIARELRDPRKILEHVRGAGRSRPALDGAYVPPRTELERRIAEIWAESLGIRPVGIHDDFFDLGGHSLLAVELMARLHRELGIQLSMELVYSGAFTVAETARATELSQMAQASKSEYEAVLEEIEGLSDEEVRELLAREGGSCESC